MKKIILIPALLAGTLAFSSEYNYEITPMIGYVMNENNLDLNNHITYGVEAQFNQLGERIHPELSVFYAKGEFDTSKNEPDIYRIALNGVYEYQKLGFITPLAKAGFGYRNIQIHENDMRNTIFLDAGIGAKIPLTKHIALKLETAYMLDHNHMRWDSDLSVQAGINIAFGGKTQKPAPIVVVPVDGDDDNDGVKNSVDNCLTTPAGTVVDSHGCKVDGDDDKDGVKNSVDTCLTTPVGVTVDAKGCELDSDNDGIKDSVDTCPTSPAGVAVDAKGCELDSDNDGIKDSMDKCSNTKANHVVNSDGCIEEIDLHINFKTGSSEVDAQSDENIARFAEFLNAAPSYSAEIIGYTDSVGSAKGNQKLSLKRATIVKDMILNKGVSESRLHAVGMGEENPIADNATKEGRAENRRIEAKLLQN